MKPVRPDDRSHTRPLYVVGNPKGMLRQGNLDLASRPTVRNRDGSISTVRSITVTDDAGRAILLPTVIGNRVVSDLAAVKHFQKTGQNLGVFANEKLANAYSEALHRQQEQMYPNVPPPNADKKIAGAILAAKTPARANKARRKEPSDRVLRDPIYAKIWKLLGLGGAPPVVTQEDLSAWNAAGMQPNGNRDVFISPEVARGIQSLPFSVGRNEDALKVLLHEYVHVRQPDMQKRANIEGGAEAYAGEHLLPMLQQLGLLPSGDVLPTENFAPATMYPRPAYSPLVHRLLTKPGGRAFINSLQFGEGQ